MAKVKLKITLKIIGVRYHARLLFEDILVDAHKVDNYICNDQRLSTGGANCSQPASGCVLLRHMCE